MLKFILVYDFTFQSNYINILWMKNIRLKYKIVNLWKFHNVKIINENIATILSKTVLALSKTHFKEVSNVAGTAGFKTSVAIA
jgi:hypothetical protein